MELGTLNSSREHRHPLNTANSEHSNSSSSSIDGGVDNYLFSQRYNNGDSRRHFPLESAFAHSPWTGNVANSQASTMDGYLVSYADGSVDSDGNGGNGFHNKSKLSLVGYGIIATATVLAGCFFVLNGYFWGLPIGSVLDACSVSGSNECSSYTYPEGYNAKELQLVDANTTLGKYLFRSSLLLSSGGGSIAQAELIKGLHQEAVASNIELSPHVDLHIHSLMWGENNRELNEKCEISREFCLLGESGFSTDLLTSYSGSEKDKGHGLIKEISLAGLQHWPLYGERVNPYDLSEKERNAIAGNMEKWCSDELDAKVDSLHEKLFPKGLKKQTSKTSPALENNKDQSEKGSILIIHCHHGQDRTGLLTAAYRMKYLKFSLLQAWVENRKMQMTLKEAINSLMWYCLYLETAKNNKDVKCYNLYSENPNVAFVSNGKGFADVAGIEPANAKTQIAASTVERTSDSIEKPNEKVAKEVTHHKK